LVYLFIRETGINIYLAQNSVGPVIIIHAKIV